LLIPSIEIRKGDADPAALVSRLVASGIRRIQLIDHGGSADALVRAIGAADGAEVQVAGGVDSEEAVQRLLDAGAQYVVLDTRAATHGHTLQDLCLEFPNHILVSLEAASGRPAADHWSKFAQHSALEVAQQFEREGVAAVIHHDRGDGDGPSVAATVALARGVQVPVIAAGGVHKPSQVAALAAAHADGLAGALLDPACLADGFDLDALLRAAKQSTSDPCSTGATRRLP
jgi:phosphoribosylformimino-5-aminoimidazole carboxamide ribotide isomerase